MFIAILSCCDQSTIRKEWTAELRAKKTANRARPPIMSVSGCWLCVNPMARMRGINSKADANRCAVCPLGVWCVTCLMSFGVEA